MSRGKLFLLATLFLLVFATSTSAAPWWCPDFTGDDNFVNFADFAVFASNWQQSGEKLDGDFDGSGTVDVNDLGTFVGYWLTEVNCPEYYPDSLPYMTSFESYQQFEVGYSLDYQNGWEVVDGSASIVWSEEWVPEMGQYMPYRWVYINVDSTIGKTFDSEGNDDRYIRCEVVAEKGAEVVIYNGTDIVAAAKFNDNFRIHVLDNGTYVDSGDSWSYSDGWSELKFDMDYSSDDYDVFYKGSSIATADFDDDYDTLTRVEVRNSDVDWVGLNKISVSDWSSGNLFIDIDSPCACDDDLELKGRVPIKGTAWGDNFGKYDIYFCPVDLDISDFNNWIVADEGWNVVDNGILGYWDTSRIPNGRYHIAVVLFNDLGYPEGLPDNWFQVIWKTLEINGNVVYEGPGYFSVISDLKCNTFYHEEESDISVPWPGQFPFELKRRYNNNRRFYNEPLRNGWTHNNQIILFEDSTYDWEKIDHGFWEGYPAYDEDMVGFGHIWVTYPDGSRKMFRHTDGSYGDDYWGDTKYYPYPKNNTGEYIIRRTYTDTDYFVRWIYLVEYELHQKDGFVLEFDTGSIHIEYPEGLNYGSRFGKVTAPMKTMKDRLGNTLNFTWNYDKTAVTSISDGTRTIEFTMNGDYYTQAQLKIGAQVYRTVTYNWNNPNKIFTVTKQGYGVDPNGVYDSGTLKQYDTKYKYDDQWNLIKVVYDDDISKPSIEIEYDNYGRVGLRKEYIDPNNYLPTSFDYTFYHPVPGNKNISHLKTETSTPFKAITTIQNERGNLIEQRNYPEDGTAVTDANAYYNDGQNPLKPTDIDEFFDGMVRKTWNDYDSDGDLIERRIYIDDVNYVATEFTYHPDYSLITSQTTWQDYNKNGQLVQTFLVYGDSNGTENPNGDYLVKEKVLLTKDPNIWAQTSYEYYNNGLVKQRTDPNGFITYYEYDDSNYKKLIKMGTTGSLQSVQRFYHDAIGQLRIQASYLGGVILNDYDDFGRLWKVRRYVDADAMTIPDGSFVPSRYEGMTPVLTTIYGYDERGNRTYEDKSLCACGEVFTSYTVSGLPKKVSYADDSYLQYNYDSRGLKVEEYRYDANSGQDWWIVYWYDNMDRLTQTAWYDYDDTSVVMLEVSDYYGSGRKEYEDIYGYNLTLEKQTDYHYDILGRLTSRVVAPDSFNLTTSYNYDAVGNQVSVTDPNGSIIYFGYDNANRKITEYFAATEGTDITEAIAKKDIQYYGNSLIKDTNSYDYDGTLLSRNEFQYDARRRVTKVTQQIDDANLAETFYDYSDTGFGPGDEYHIKITDAEGKVTWQALCPFGRTVKTEYPSGDYAEVEFNGDGTLKRKAVWDASDVKNWIEYYYDGYARLVDVNYPDGGNVHYSYDGFGRKIQTTDNRNADDRIGGTNTITYQYDVLDRIAGVTEHDNYSIEYTYQADGQKQSIAVYDPCELQIYSVEYYYDAASRLEYIIEPPLGLNGFIAEFGYDKNGNRKKLTYYRTGNPLGAKVSIDYAYDLENNLRGFSTTGGPTFSLGNTTVDGLGRLLYADETITQTDSNTVDHSYTYEYDMLSRLLHAYTSNVPPTPAREYTYNYDKAGNTTSYIFNNYNPDNEVTYYYTYTGDLRTGKTGGKYCTYDKNGGQTSLWQDDPGDFPVIYDWDGRIRRNRYLLSGLGMEARYTPDGVRIWKKRNWNLSSYEHKYIVDMAGNIPSVLLVLDANDDNNILKTYIHAQNQVIAQHDGDYNTSRYFYLHDRLGSVRQVIDTSGNVQNCYYYTPWGSCTGSETDETIDNGYGWAGYYFDDEVDGYHCNARNYYSGRFMSRDPVCGIFEEPMTLHAYLYCFNDPVNKTDPTGELWGVYQRAKMVTKAVNIRAELMTRALNIAQDAWQAAEMLETIHNTQALLVIDPGRLAEWYLAHGGDYLGCVGQCYIDTNKKVKEALMIAAFGKIVALPGMPVSKDWILPSQKQRMMLATKYLQKYDLFGKLGKFMGGPKNLLKSIRIASYGGAAISIAADLYTIGVAGYCAFECRK